MKNNMDAGYPGEEADWSFHYTIAEATHNPFIIRLMNTMIRVFNKTRPHLHKTTGTTRRLFKEHCRIFEAIRVMRGMPGGLCMNTYKGRN